jgi:hypothetical protein
MGSPVTDNGRRTIDIEMFVPARPRMTTIINVPNSPCPQPIGGGFLSSVRILLSSYRYGHGKENAWICLHLCTKQCWKQQYLVSFIVWRRAKCLHHRFVRLFFKAFLPSVTHSGVAFECHAQICLTRFDLKTKELLGFVIRDLGGSSRPP